MNIFNLLSIDMNTTYTCGPGHFDFEGMFPIITSTIVTIIKIGVPILLIIIGMIDLGKGVFAQDEKEMKKGQGLFVRRLISAALVFLVVFFVQLIVRFVASSKNDDIMSCVLCFINGEEKYCREHSYTSTTNNNTNNGGSNSNSNLSDEDKVLEQIRNNSGSATKASIVRATGLSDDTVSQILKNKYSTFEIIQVKTIENGTTTYSYKMRSDASIDEVVWLAVKLGGGKSTRGSVQSATGFTQEQVETSLRSLRSNNKISRTEITSGDTSNGKYTYKVK